ncbi:DsbA family protein [Gorillibacterium timonense]|uniref:DsbA family protein n=1 Tax=Gorillibacterium timonense TaxID=1689269 RepID=UPI00071DF13F|nr:thioredoxin domain-containing protein [Gorillibacterium timonense]
MARNQKRTSTNGKWFIPLFLGGLVVLLGVLIFLNRYTESQDKQAQADLLKDMPNWTQIRGDIDTSKGIEYDKQPSLGSPDAKVKVVEVADFKCPACMKWSTGDMKLFKEKYIDTGKVQFFFMNYPFIDRDSILAASAGEALFHQSNEAFWQFADKLYEQQGDEETIWATRDFLSDFVKKNVTGIDYDKFAEDFKNDTYMLDVKLDYKVGGSLGVNGTPQFFINGVHQAAPQKGETRTTYERLTEAVEAELAK